MHNQDLRVHFIGIGGIGMSALARWFIAKNWIVSGSDLEPSSITQELVKDGVKIKYGHKKSHITNNLAMVIASTAIRKDNLEYGEAVRHGLKPMTYPEAVGCLTDVYDVVGVAGSHGKSTTSSMISLLMANEYDPNVIIGTTLKEFGNKNFHHGESRWLVLEADEYKRAFTHYRTRVAVVTNIDREHLDYYKNLKDVQSGFLQFLSKVVPGGAMVLNKDDENLLALKNRIETRAKKNKIKVHWYSLKQAEAKLIDGSLKLSGRHNLSNAMAAYTVGVKVLGLPSKEVIDSLSKFNGSWRRMDHRGRMKIRGKKVEVYDDYGHHPTEIKATLQAFRERYPRARLICVYEPHQAKRLSMLFDEFKSAFEQADLLILLPIYGVAGRDKVNKKHTSKNLVEEIIKKYPENKVEYLAKSTNFLKDATKLMKKHFSPLPSSVVVMMGAGDIFKLTPKLLKSK